MVLPQFRQVKRGVSSSVRRCRHGAGGRCAHVLVPRVPGVPEQRGVRSSCHALVPTRDGSCVRNVRAGTVRAGGVRSCPLCRDCGRRRSCPIRGGRSWVVHRHAGLCRCQGSASACPCWCRANSFARAFPVENTGKPLLAPAIRQFARVGVLRCGERGRERLPGPAERAEVFGLRC